MTDPTGGTNYSITGTSQLLSVPYALHAQTAENITGEITVTETDPLFSTSIASSITATDTAKWNQSNTAAGAQLDSAGIATMGYVAGPKTIDTKLDETAVDAFVANNGYLIQEKDSSVTNEIELPTGGNSGQILSTDGSGTYSWIDSGAGGLVADAINDGATTVAPSQNAVFDGLALKAPLVSPTFTGTPVAPTASDATTNTTQIATTAFVQSVSGGLVADAINDGTTGVAPSQNAVFDGLALKASIADAIFTGTPTAPTAASGTNTTQIATTAFVQSAAASDINGLSDALVESGSIYIGSDPSSTTDDASSNTSLGGTALDAITTGDFNVAIGSRALSANTTGQYNAASGTNALYSNTTGSQNTASGSNALYSNTTGGSNVAFGNLASYRSTTGNWNTSVGYQALIDNTTGDHNVALGSNALYANTTADYNVAIGSNALSANTTGSRNVVSGHDAGDLITTGSNNVILGNSADPSANNATNQIVIGYNATGNGDNEITLGNSSITTLRAQVTSITSLSDKRDKTEIVSLTEGLDFIKQLKPVSFTWDTRDKAKVGIKSAGFIAQDLLALQQASLIGENLDLVSEVNPEKLEARYANLLPVIVKAIQEESAMKDKEIADLKESVRLLQEQMKKLINQSKE